MDMKWPTACEVKRLSNFCEGFDSEDGLLNDEIVVAMLVSKSYKRIFDLASRGRGSTALYESFPLYGVENTYGKIMNWSFRVRKGSWHYITARAMEILTENGFTLENTQVNYYEETVSVYFALKW